MSHTKKLFSASIGGFNRAQVVEYLEEMNRKARIEKEQAEFEISRLESEAAELASLREKFSEITEKLAEIEKQNELLKSDIENQRATIEALQISCDSLSVRNAELEKEVPALREKALVYEQDKQNAGGILARAKAEAEKLFSQAKSDAAALLEKSRKEASEHAEKVNAESEKLVEENIRKVKYLYRRRDELLSAFQKVKDAAGGFYDSVANTLSDGKDEP